MEFTVLIVDDETEILRTLKGFLGMSGYRVLTAETGEGALAHIRTTKVHIVLSDIKMPGMSGVELLKKVREIDFSIQVIMMTGYSTFDLTLQALEHGAADYILKPFENLQDILDLIAISGDRLIRWRKVLAGSVKKRIE